MSRMKDYLYDISEKIYNYCMENDYYNILYFCGKYATSHGYDFTEFDMELIMYVITDNICIARKIFLDALQDCKFENNKREYNELYSVLSPVLNWRQ